MAGKETALYVVNSWIEQDPILADIFAPRPVLVYPGYADEPIGDEDSYPYIRYQSIKIPSRSNPLLRRDWCQYFVGAKDFTVVDNAIERLMYILNTPESGDLSYKVPDPTGKYKIMNIIVHTGTIPNSPSQDEGVWEQGVSFTMYYVISNPGWGTRKKHFNIDAKIV